MEVTSLPAVEESDDQVCTVDIRVETHSLAIRYDWPTGTAQTVDGWIVDTGSVLSALAASDCLGCRPLPVAPTVSKYRPCTTGMAQAYGSETLQICGTVSALVGSTVVVTAHLIRSAVAGTAAIWGIGASASGSFPKEISPKLYSHTLQIPRLEGHKLAGKTAAGLVVVCDTGCTENYTNAPAEALGTLALIDLVQASALNSVYGDKFAVIGVRSCMAGDIAFQWDPATLLIVWNGTKPGA